MHEIQFSREFVFFFVNSAHVGEIYSNCGVLSHLKGFSEKLTRILQIHNFPFGVTHYGHFNKTFCRLKTDLSLKNNQTSSTKLIARSAHGVILAKPRDALKSGKRNTALAQVLPTDAWTHDFTIDFDNGQTVEENN